MSVSHATLTPHCYPGLWGRFAPGSLPASRLNDPALPMLVIRGDWLDLGT